LHNRRPSENHGDLSSEIDRAFKGLQNRAGRLKLHENDTDLAGESPEPAFEVKRQTACLAVVGQDEFSARHEAAWKLPIPPGRRKRLRRHSNIVPGEAVEELVDGPLGSLQIYCVHGIWSAQRLNRLNWMGNVSS
jgi:hypothetical protein